MIRGAMPANRDAPLVSREPLDGAYVLLTFHHPEVALEARAGQFVMMKAGRSAAPPLRRPFSILRVDPPKGTFTIFLKVVGEGSRALAALRPGETALCLGPLGRPFSAPADGAEPLMVAGGYGIAPFLMLSEELSRSRRPGRVFYGGRSAVDLQVRALFAEPGMNLVSATEDGSLGHKGRVTEPLEAYLEGRESPTVLFACGPNAMLHAVARIAQRRRIPCQVSLEPWMGCGVGTCLGCVVWIQTGDETRPRYRCACTEGPIFDADVVVWPGDEASAARRRAAP
jgi:dihydroorotate dehydrogenase electron transfer subunit